MAVNDDEPSARIAELKHEHRRLDSEIESMVAAGAIDQVEIARLKKRKLRLRDEIELLVDRSTPDIIA